MHTPPTWSLPSTSPLDRCVYFHLVMLPGLTYLADLSTWIGSLQQQWLSRNKNLALKIPIFSLNTAQYRLREVCITGSVMFSPFNTVPACNRQTCICPHRLAAKTMLAIAQQCNAHAADMVTAIYIATGQVCSNLIMLPGLIYFFVPFPQIHTTINSSPSGLTSHTLFALELQAYVLYGT